MATFRDPERTFAPLEVVERLLQIRAEAGFESTIYLDRSNQLTDILDAYGFDIYAFSTGNDKIDYEQATMPVVPGGDNIHNSARAH